MSGAQRRLEQIRDHARERYDEAKVSLDANDPLSARFMWASIVMEEMKRILDMIDAPLEP